MSVCYVVALWGGPRRRASADQTGMSYLTAQIKALRELPHGLDHILFVNSRCGLIAEYETALQPLREADWCEVLDRDNVGLSYGAWSVACAKHGSRFDYYILVEDDYVPAIPYFDRILVELLEKKGPRCAFLAGSVEPAGPYGDYPVTGVTIGMVRSAAIADLPGGKLPHAAANGYDGADGAQRNMAASFIKVGWFVDDWLDQYMSTFVDYLGNRLVFGEGPGKEAIFDAVF